MTISAATCSTICDLARDFPTAPQAPRHQPQAGRRSPKKVGKRSDKTQWGSDELFPSLLPNHKTSTSSPPTLFDTHNQLSSSSHTFKMGFTDFVSDAGLTRMSA